MKPIDKTAAGQTDCIALELDLPHAPAKVWRALTEPELMSQWLLPVTGFELAPGVAFKLQTQPYPGWDGSVNCRIVEFEERRRLTYSWVVGDMELDTVVTFTLEPIDAGTRLSIVQSGFRPTQKQNWGGARYGWKMMGEKLFELLGRDA